jgi:predicted nucleotidyltransferase
VNLNLYVNVKAMDFRHRKQELLERAKLVEQDAYRVKTAQAQDILRLLAALYRDMARELDKGSEVRKYMH